jgi:ABC-type antimicrobial peptide transport system permease subunit
MGAGLLLGIPAAMLFGRILSSLLAGVEATELTGYAVVSLVLALAVMLSALVPAIRASRVDPIVALRAD